MSIFVKQTHFKARKFEADYSSDSIVQYESTRTGMRVVTVDRKGPKLRGYFVMGTQFCGESQAPHVLEHLCFKGSRDYKHDGTLRRLGTRAYSSINGHTKMDHTVYNLDSAGWEGFAQMLPVFLDHILFPTLTDAGHYTEVHHIDGTGNDAGVVYSELQDDEDRMRKYMRQRAHEVLYPGENGFRYDTCSTVEQLRILTADRIREFHKDVYKPKNLSLVIVGEVDHEMLLPILEKFEDTIPDDVSCLDLPVERPYIQTESSPAPSKTVVDTIEFPEEDESFGVIRVGFSGPRCSDKLNVMAMDTLLKSSMPLLRRQMDCSITYFMEYRTHTVVWFFLSGITTQTLAEVEKRFIEILKDMTLKPLDTGRIGNHINQVRKQLLLETEDSADSTVDSIIRDHLYGERDGSTLSESLKPLSMLKALQEWTDQHWSHFLSSWLADAQHVSILGVPSRELCEKLENDEKARVKAQQESLSEEDLEKLTQKLEDAKAENNKPLPLGILQSFKVPEVESIHFIPSTSARSGFARRMGHLDNEIQNHVDQDKNDVPLFIHFESVQTNFVFINLFLSTKDVPPHLKYLLPVYIRGIFTSAIIRDGKRIDAATELKQNVVGYQTLGGSSIGHSEFVGIRLSMEPGSYETVIKGLKEVVFGSIFEVKRLETIQARILADARRAMLEGQDMAYAVDRMVHSAPHSFSHAQNILAKANHLACADMSKVISSLEDLRKSLLRLSNIRILVIADVPKLASPVSAWGPFITSLDTEQPIAPLTSIASPHSPKDSLSSMAKAPGGLTYIIPMSTTGSSYAFFTSCGPDSHQHPSLPALMVTIAYLEAPEGPLWSSTYGAGLAYGMWFLRPLDVGILTYHIFRSPNAFKAYEAGRSVIEALIDGSRLVEEYALESAIASIVERSVDEQSSMFRAAMLKFEDQVMKGIPNDWKKVILERARAVGTDEIRAMLKEFVLPLFLPGRTNVVVTCPTIMEGQLRRDFDDAGFEPEIRDPDSFVDGEWLEEVGLTEAGPTVC